MSFDTFGLHRTLLRAIQTLGYTDPTPIQQAAIPAVHWPRFDRLCANGDRKNGRLLTASASPSPPEHHTWSTGAHRGAHA